MGGGVTVANWRADDVQPAFREELMISVSRGSRSSENSPQEGGGQQLDAGRLEEEMEGDFSGGI